MPTSEESLKTLPVEESIPATSAEEEVPEREEHFAQLILSAMASKFSVTSRDAHPKHHGLLTARFVVSADLDPRLRRGLFAKPGTYDAYIRFSNSHPDRSQPDWMPDVRGMAIKIMGVEGPRELLDEDATQDFVLSSHPVFFAKNAQDYVNFLKELKNRDSVLGNILNNPKFPHYKQMAAGRKSHANPLSITYFSQTPYAFGEGPAVKYKVVPKPDPKRPFRDDFPNEDKAKEEALRPDGDFNTDFLSQAMAAYLRDGGAEFSFCVQFQKDPSKPLIEDATVEWDTPPIEVATLVIPKQEFQFAKQWELAEHISYSPWHCLSDHRPLGGINRARKQVYLELSRIRHRMNRVPEREPTGKEVLQPVQNQLNLIMTLKGKADYLALNELLSFLKAQPPQQNHLARALDALGTVHFARFLFLEPRENDTWYAKLAVLTTYDGEFDDYVLGFVDTVGALFNRILTHVEGWEPAGKKVEEHPEDFLKFVDKWNKAGVGTMYSAYPELRVTDIRDLSRRFKERPDPGGNDA